MKTQTEQEKRQTMSLGQRSYATILLAILALVAITAATAAWFSISDNTHVYSMGMEITAGPALRIDASSHPTFEEHLQTLPFERIADAVRQRLNYDMRTTPMKPVTTQNCETFTLRSGTVEPVTSGAYWEFPLYFMATEDMVVHLTAANSPGADDGTRIQSAQPTLPQSMRISFTADGKTVVYDPGMGDNSTVFAEIKNFGLQSASDTVYNQNSVLFSLSKQVEKTVMVRIWMEGTDEACTDQLKESDFTIQMRFEGTDENGQPLSGRPAQ